MGVAIDYEKVLTEIVFVNLPGPAEMVNAKGWGGRFAGAGSVP